MGDLVGIKIPEDEFLDRFRDHLQNAKGAFTSRRERDSLYYAAYAGDPWPPGVKEAMENEDRPTVTHNLALTIVDTVLGEEMNERREVQFQGVGTDLHDIKAAEWLTFLTRTWFAQIDGHRHEMHALFDQLVTGYGWGHVYLDMGKFPFKPALEHVETWEMWPDPRAKDDNLSDARWLIREREWLLEDVEAMWPDKAKDIGARTHSGSTSRIVPQKVVSDYEGDGFEAPGEDTCTVWEYQFKKKERWVAFIEPQTQIRDSLPESEFKKIAKELRAQGMEPPASQPFLRDVFYRAFMAGSAKTDTVILQPPERIPADRFTYVCLTGFRHKLADSGRTEFFGLMHLLYEPQLFAAKVHSMIVEVMARSNKNAVLYEAGAFPNPRKAIEDLAKPGAAIEVADGAVKEGRVQFTTSPPYPNALGELLSYSVGALYRASGITEFLMGNSTRERSNVLIQNYQERSLTLLAPLTDPLEGFRIGIGRVLAAFIQRYVPAEDIDRMIGDEGIEGLTIQMAPDPMTGQMVPQPIATPSSILKELNLMDFDVVVDTGAATSTERQHIWSILSEQGVMKFMAESGVPMDQFFPHLLRLMPIRAEVAKQLGDTMEQQMQQAQAAQTAEGMVQVFSELDPQTQQQVHESIMQIVQQSQPQPEGGEQPAPPAPEGGAPVQ